MRHPASSRSLAAAPGAGFPRLTTCLHATPLHSTSNRRYAVFTRSKGYNCRSQRWCESGGRSRRPSSRRGVSDAQIRRPDPGRIGRIAPGPRRRPPLAPRGWWSEVGGRWAMNSCRPTFTIGPRSAKGGVMLQAVPSSSELEDVVDTTHRMRAAVEGVVTGRPELVRVTVAVLLAEGHLLLEDVPGRRQDHARQGAGQDHRLHGRPDPVHARPAALGPHGRQHLPVADARVRVPARARVRARRHRRRDQPRLAQDAVGAARVHAGGAGDRRRPHLPAAATVPRRRHPEPRRDGGHLPAARGAARPVHGPPDGRLPEHRVRARHARPAGDVRPARHPAARDRRRAGARPSSRPRAGCSRRPASSGTSSTS